MASRQQEEAWIADRRGMGRTGVEAVSAIQLCMAPHVLRKVLNKAIAVDLWSRLEELYITKSLTNKICLKKRLYTFRMAECTPVQKYLNKFNSILVDLESLNIKIKDEDKVILLVVSLPPPINILRRLYYIVILILYRLRISSLICYLRRN